MRSTELEAMAAMAAEMEQDDLEEFLQVLVDNSPLETLSLISLILFTKTKTMEHMDRALRWAEGALVSTTSDEDCGARLGFLTNMLSRSAESLLRATQLGLIGIVDALVQIGAEAENQNIRGKGLLHEACKSGNISVVRVLLERNIDPKERNAKNETALMVAARHGDDAIVRLLLEHKAEIEAEDQDGDSALHTAAYHGCESVARALLESGAKPTVCGGSGYTPMQLALNRGHLGLAQLLLEFKAWSDLADDTWTPLSQLTGSGIFQQIELAQKIMFPASMTLTWLDRMRFVVAASSSSDHELELIEPGPGCTMAEPYIAISYCWGRSASSDKPLRIRVPSRTKPGEMEIREARASRDTLQRSLDYAAAKGVKRIWIDQECIHQDDHKDKEDAMQNMHLVYRRAKTTLVLLGRHVQTLVEVASLHESILKVGKCSELKRRITSDKWFTRAWTCQEYGVTPAENLRYLVGWDEALDKDAYLWEMASHSFNNKSRDLVQNNRRSWEFTYREIGGMSFEGEQGSSILSLSTEIGITGTGEENEVMYTLTNDSTEEMYWWNHGLSFRFGTKGCDNIPDKTYPNGCDHPSSSIQQKWPKLRMSLLAALSIQRQKACSVFSDKLAILGNLTDYPYRLYPRKAFEEQLSFSACALAMALFNGDLSPLFTNDMAYVEHDGKEDIQRGLLLSQTCLYTLADGRSPYSRTRARLTAGSKCLVLGGKLLVEGLLWKIVPYTGLKDLEMANKAVATNDSRHPIRFHFFQRLVRKLVALQRIDLLELVVTSIMQRQLTSPLEMVHFLNDLQAWARDEQLWPKNIAEDSFLECAAAPPGMSVVDSNGRKRKVVQYRTFKDARGMDFALANLEPDDSDPPTDLLSLIHNAVLNKRPLALGECKVGDQTLVSLYMFDPSEHQWVLTPVDELDYEFGKNPWLHMHAKDTFWCVTKDEQTILDAHSQRAAGILDLGADGEKHLSNETLKVVTSGTRLHTSGTWSPRLSRRGVLTIGDDRAWKMIPLGQAKYFWLTGAEN